MIKKLESSWNWDVYGNRLLKRYDLENYSPKDDKNVPVIFFGCYGQGIKREIMNQRRLVVIVWSGGDGVRLHEDTGFVTFCRENSHRVFHIAHSHWLQTDLKHWGLQYIDRVVLPLLPEAFKFEETVGDLVYHYGPKQRGWYYGRPILAKLRGKWETNKRFPRVVITEPRGYNQAELYDIYKESFIGVRLTEHDNMALSCIELGLMGRRSIFNGNIPCAIPYSEVSYKYNPETKRQWVYQKEEELLPKVERMILEAWRDPKPDKLLAEEMREFVYDDKEWLKTTYYENITI